MISVSATIPQTSLTVDIVAATAVAANPTPVPVVNVPMLGATIGIPGATGPRGLIGPTGPSGPQGAASTVPGPQGPAGNTGSQGIQGVAGPQGLQGPKGDPGASGVWQQLTAASYAALAVKDPNTLYVIVG